MAGIAAAHRPVPKIDLHCNEGDKIFRIEIAGQFTIQFGQQFPGSS
jgi:hypothetical protein